MGTRGGDGETEKRKKICKDNGRLLGSRNREEEARRIKIDKSKRGSRQGEDDTGSGREIRRKREKIAVWKRDEGNGVWQEATHRQRQDEWRTERKRIKVKREKVVRE